MAMIPESQVTISKLQYTLEQGASTDVLNSLENQVIRETYQSTTMSKTRTSDGHVYVLKKS